MNDGDNCFVTNTETAKFVKFGDIVSIKKTIFECSLVALTRRVIELREVEKFSIPTEGIVNNVNEKYIKSFYISE